MITRAAVREAIRDQISIQQEHRDPEVMLTSVGVANPSGVAEDLEAMATRLCSLNTSLTPEEAMAVGLLEGFTAGIRASGAGSSRP
jgi:hypothetical protein